MAIENAKGPDMSPYRLEHWFRRKDRGDIERQGIQPNLPNVTPGRLSGSVHSRVIGTVLAKGALDNGNKGYQGRRPACE